MQGWKYRYYIPPRQAEDKKEVINHLEILCRLTMHDDLVRELGLDNMRIKELVRKYLRDLGIDPPNNISKCCVVPDFDAKTLRISYRIFVQ